MRSTCCAGTRDDECDEPPAVPEEPDMETAWAERNRLCGVAKRVGDVVASLAGLLLLSPVLVAVALHIKRTSPGRCSTGARGRAGSAGTS
jgi:lipopolysaccharide/colanic/teichoic acid biosynthesis glycosyltransferase